MTGSVDATDVDPRHTAVREVQEETNLAVQSADLVDLGMSMCMRFTRPGVTVFRPS
jgi:8-oxo-dGTP pyrophosphatase MutT (NUDIX family)